VKTLVDRYGRAPLDYFKTWPDKAYCFSPGGRSVIAYRVAWSVAVRLKDPVGPEQELRPLIGSSLTFCGSNGWKAAFHQEERDRHHERILAIHRSPARVS
jgi:lysylphosphatidylglycerol synthetase-like protein (DUF2156 family)